jgi:hypothetical protein
VDRARIAAMVRLFKENGLKMLLEHPGNVRDLFRIIRYPLADQIDFAKMEVQPATFITRDFRHVESDLLLTVPFRPAGSRSRRQTITIYILIEHQSEPDRLMRFRVLDYAVQVYKVQLRKWGQSHRSFTDFSFLPVLPIVFYTGRRSWDELPDMPQLTAQGLQFHKVLPNLEPIFLNLRMIESVVLQREGGPFGQVMRLLQNPTAPLETIQTLLTEVVETLEATMPPAERMRWLELMTYLHAFVYHYREVPERSSLQDRIADSVRTEALQREVRIMGQTGYEFAVEEGRKVGELRAKRETLLLLMRSRFGKVSAKYATRIKAEINIVQLDEWLTRFATAERLEDLGIL